jgi:hypothetical protein
MYWKYIECGFLTLLLTESMDAMLSFHLTRYINYASTVVLPLLLTFCFDFFGCRICANVEALRFFFPQDYEHIRCRCCRRSCVVVRRQRGINLLAKPYIGLMTESVLHLIMPFGKRYFVENIT